jgi:uncharacterized protein (DUF2336 family)
MDPKILLHMAQDTSEAGRRRLAKSVSQFFDTKGLTEAEQSLAADILMTLVHQAEADLREALAERLAMQSTVPAELVVFLANDRHPVARHILQHSPVLTDCDLLRVIASKDADYWRTIAQRDTLSASVTRELVETGDAGTAFRLVDNPCISLEKPVLKKIVRISLTAEELQEPLTRRPEIDAELATDLYMVVSQALQRDILSRFPAVEETAAAALEDLVAELSDEARGLRRTTAAMRALARRCGERGRLTTDLMIRTLRRGQQGFFVALFAERTALEPDQVVRLIQRDGGRPFAVACRAINTMKAEFATLFLLSRGIRTGEKIVDAQELASALRSFDELKEADVKRIMHSWREDPTLLA